MGFECCFWCLLLQGSGVSFADTSSTNDVLGTVAEIMATRLAERFRAVLCCSSPLVIILASVFAEQKLGREEGWIDEEGGLSAPKTRPICPSENVNIPFSSGMHKAKAALHGVCSATNIRDQFILLSLEQWIKSSEYPIRLDRCKCRV